MNYKSEQEKFWAGQFGQEYIKRNSSEQLVYSKVAMWSRMLKSASGIESIRELGCNIGINLLALKKLNPQIELQGYEINEDAISLAQKLNVADIHHQTILSPIEAPPVDLTFTAGVLIHINPDHLGSVYENLIRGSKKYVLVAEYYNPTPVAIPYRGHEDKLFKRDFAGELIKKYNLSLVDYGFVYRGDNWAPQDDITWFLMQKKV